MHVVRKLAVSDDVTIRIVVDCILIVVVAIAACNTYQLREVVHRQHVQQQRQTAEAMQRRKAALGLCIASNETRRVILDVLHDAAASSPPAAQDFYRRQIARVHLSDCRPFAT